jgi:predicted metal-dependent phosphoesterase TrpH
MSHLINVDLHCHTAASEDSDILLVNLINECDRKGVQKLAITDHNRIDWALEAVKRWPSRIIPGLEIMTSLGELIAYYVHEPIEKGLTPFETIRALKAQDAVISVSHPFDRWRNGGWKTPCLQEILPYLDAIEIFNAHCISNLPNRQAQIFARGHQLVGTAGSDAHSNYEIGVAGLTLEDFHDSTGLREALCSATIFGHRTSLGTRMIKRVKRSLLSRK